MGIHYDATLDAHARPPESLRVLFKSIQRMATVDLDGNSAILDFEDSESIYHHATQRESDTDQLLLRAAETSFLDKPSSSNNPVNVFEVNSCPGLFIYPGLLSKEVQIHLLDKLLHRDLSNSQHLTNIHLFHEMRYPADNSAVTDGLDVRSTSFFATNSDTLLQPKDAEMHKPMSIAQLLRKKLRWITLGGQYDWTNKVYPPEEPPQFPPDIASLLAAYFPTISAQAAIVNLYTPGDTLSVHRDVSEECERDLVSISIGCDALFLVGTMDGSDSTVVRLRSGDAVLMSGASRFSWHGVPKVIAETCPNGLADWPCSDVTDSSLECWRGWLRSKRINLNVRQMRETSLDRAAAT